jgi:hypothetical protein
MKWSVILLVLFFFGESYAQIQRDNRDRLYPTLLDKGSHVTDVQVRKVQVLFQTVEEGIVGAHIGKFSDHFDKQIFVNITRGENGYFSSDQAASLLQHYLETRKVVSFKFSRVNDSGPTPYATGRLVTIYRGTLESAQVYVSCSWQTSDWVIGQFNIY